MSPIEIEIQRHTASVKSCMIDPPKGCCPRCSEQPTTFKRHDCRVRFFRFIVESFVHVVESLLIRWKCGICGRTFTDYPSFAFPHKRYVLMDIERFSRDYVEHEQQTYRQTASHNDMPIGYEERDGIIDECWFSHTTPWRWIGRLGAMKNTAAEARHLIRQKDSNSSIFREVFPVSPRKYQSLERKLLLQGARALLRAQEEFCRLFGHKIFPYFATICS